MKKPDSWKHESWLRRILDAQTFDAIVYFEEAVLVDSNTLQPKGYHLFLVTETSLHILQTAKSSSLDSGLSWSLTGIHSVRRLNDVPTFFGSNVEVAQSSKHIQLAVSDQVASDRPIIDFYSFYEDSTLYHYLFQAWQQAHIRQSLPVFYPTDRNKLTRLTNKLAIQALYHHLENQLLQVGKEDVDDPSTNTASVNADAHVTTAASPPPTTQGTADADNPMTPLKAGSAALSDDGQRVGGSAATASVRNKMTAAKLRAKKRAAADTAYWDVRMKIRLVEELTVAASVHRSFRRMIWESASLIPFLLNELRALSRYRAYLLGADPVEIWSLHSHASGLSSAALVEDEVDAIRYLIAIWTLLSRCLSGGETVGERVKLFGGSSTDEKELQQTMDALFLLGGLHISTRQAMEAGIHAGMSMSRMEDSMGMSMSGGAGGMGNNAPVQVSPSQFLDALEHFIAATGGGGQNPLLSATNSPLANRRPFGASTGMGMGGMNMGMGMGVMAPDDDEQRVKHQFLYNLRAQRKWREGILASYGETFKKELGASGATSPNKTPASPASTSVPPSLHLRDVPRILAAAREEHSRSLGMRGTRSRLGSTAGSTSLDPPPSADDIGYESVLIANDGASRIGLNRLRELMPELEVAYVEILFHFTQLLEQALEIRAGTAGMPSATGTSQSVQNVRFNLEHFFHYLLVVDHSSSASSSAAASSSTAAMGMGQWEEGRDFLSIQLPVLCRGMVFLCQKDRHPTLAYFVFVYASVLSKCVRRSVQLQQLLRQQGFIDLMSVDHTSAALHASLTRATSGMASPNKSAQKGGAPTLALLPDVVASSTPGMARGMHFYQRSKPLLQEILDILASKR